MVHSVAGNNTNDTVHGISTLGLDYSSLATKHILVHAKDAQVQTNIKEVNKDKGRRGSSAAAIRC